MNLIGTTGAFAAEDRTPQPAPEKLRLDENSSKPIGYDEYDGYYIDVRWNVTFPADSAGGYQNIYIQEAGRTATPRTIAARDIPGSRNNYRIKNLKSGKIYYIDVTAYHLNYNLDGSTYPSAESLPSNKLKVLTDIDVAAYSYGTNEIKIEWDDVWDIGKRIDYKIYVSEDSSFTNTQPIYISSQQIGENGPVKVNEATGKLEYIHRVRDPGRVYYVKVVPDVVDPQLYKNPESETVGASSFILVKTTKLSITEENDVVWQLDWSPVVTGFASGDIDVSYLIYRGVVGSSYMPEFIARVDSTSFTVLIPYGTELQYYYQIIAEVKRNGVDVYPGIRIQSDRIIVKEDEIPSTPPSPEFIDEIRKENGELIESYYDNLKPTSASVFWRVPKNGIGQIDKDTTYDIWLITDPNLVENPPNIMKIGSSVRYEELQKVADGYNTIACRFDISGLTPNTTYYFKIVAKKTYVDNVNGVLKQVEYVSYPAIKIIVTPSQGSSEQPLVPGRPPLKLKAAADGRYLVTTDSAVIQLKNKWYEEFVDGKWQYVRTEKTSENDTPDYDPVAYPPDNVKYRMVKYDEGVTFDVGCVEYTGEIPITEIVKLPANKITGFPVTANDPLEDPTLNPPETLNPITYAKHNVDIQLTGLKPNTTYVVWVKAVRTSAGLVSGPSDPILVTTLPEIIVPPEKPTVPYFTYGIPNDISIDLGWNVISTYGYTIKYGTKDNINSAIGEININPGDMADKTFYRVENLQPDTIYYFWIRAYYAPQGKEIQYSDWSGSFAVKTLPYVPPSTPRGFGIKNSADAITKNSITYEWQQVSGMEYILEIADNINYENMKEYTGISASEFKVEGLEPNKRYYARLYAYDPVRKIRSEPTQSISVRTLRSNDEYDSDQDVEKVESGDFITIGTEIIDKTWYISITGTNAIRFIEHIQTDRKLDYVIDVKNPPGKAEKIVLRISGRVFGALDSLKENLIISLNGIDVVIRSDIFSSDSRSLLADKLGDYNYEITIYPDAKDFLLHAKNLTFKIPVTKIAINGVKGSSVIPVRELARPIRAVVSYEKPEWYINGKTNPVIYDETSASWKKTSFDLTVPYSGKKGYIGFEVPKPSSFSVADSGNSYYDDIYGHLYESSITNIASIYNLKSIPGRYFDPDRTATIGDVVKLLFDVMNYNYDNNYMMAAVKAGILQVSDAAKASAYCTREKAIAMAVGAYEIKAGVKINQNYQPSNIFRDMDSVSADIRNKVEFAVRNGLVISRNSANLGPGDYITRAEAAAIIERLLALCGEIY